MRADSMTDAAMLLYTFCCTASLYIMRLVRAAFPLVPREQLALKPQRGVSATIEKPTASNNNKLSDAFTIERYNIEQLRCHRDV
jgi:hypothetical protein